MNDIRKDALTVLCAQIQTHERYHTQKENMTWLAAAAYLGATMLLVGRNAFWASWPVHWFGVWLALLLATAVIVFWFLQTQFRARHVASAFFVCANDVATQWLSTPPEAGDIEPKELRELDNMLVFAAVEKRFHSKARFECSSSERLALTLIVLWSIAAGVYVMLTYPQLCTP